MKNLESPHDHPRRLLDDTMMGPADADIPYYKELDTLYSQIFSRVRAQHLATTLKIFGFLFFRCPDAIAEPMTPDFLAHLLGLEEEGVHLCLSELHSILYVPPPGYRSSELDSEIKIIHASLQDYLVDKLRSGEYYLDERAFHTDIAEQGARQIRMLSRSTMEQNHQGLEGLSRFRKYLTSSFIYHCKRASTVSSGLKNDLMHVRDLRPWVKICPAVIKQFISFCTWLAKADTEGDELLEHMDLLWSQYFTTTDQRVDDNGNNVSNISAPWSSGSPIFRTNEGNLTSSSFNTEHNTIKDLFNNSVIQSWGKQEGKLLSKPTTAQQVDDNGNNVSNDPL